MSFKTRWFVLSYSRPVFSVSSCPSFSFSLSLCLQYVFLPWSLIKTHFKVQLAHSNFHFYHQHSRIWALIPRNMPCSFMPRRLCGCHSCLKCFCHTFLASRTLTDPLCKAPDDTSVMALPGNVGRSLVVSHRNLFITPFAFLIFKLQLFGYIFSCSTKARSGLVLGIFLSPELSRAPAKHQSATNVHWTRNQYVDWWHEDGPF